MSRYRVDPRVVRVVQMKDGTRYHPTRDGIVSVRPEHEAEMAGSGARRGTEVELDPVGLALPGGESRSCPTCGWDGWVWSVRCGRCGEVLDDH
jgi:hypothetical protein